MLLKKSKELNVYIRSRTQDLYQGYAYSVTSYNNKGVFDILPQHANFVSLIKNYIILDKGMNSEKKINLEKGLLSVIANKVDVYIDI